MTTTFTYNCRPGRFELLFLLNSEGPRLLLRRQSESGSKYSVRPVGERFDLDDWGVDLAAYAPDWDFDLPAIDLGECEVNKLQVWHDGGRVIIQVTGPSLVRRWAVPGSGRPAVEIPVTTASTFQELYRDTPAPTFASPPEMAHPSDLESEVRATIRKWIDEETSKVRERLLKIVTEALSNE